MKQRLSLRYSQELDLALPEDQDATARRQLVAKAVRSYPALRSRFKPMSEDLKAQFRRLRKAEYLLPYATELVQPHSLNWPNAGLLRRTESLIMGMTLWGASMAYGGIMSRHGGTSFPHTRSSCSGVLVPYGLPSAPPSGLWCIYWHIFSPSLTRSGSHTTRDG